MNPVRRLDGGCAGAQLRQTQAQIANAQASYDCRLALAVLQYQTTGF